jgi:hypothetical protein
VLDRIAKAGSTQKQRHVGKVSDHRVGTHGIEHKPCRPNRTKWRQCTQPHCYWKHAARECQRVDHAILGRVEVCRIPTRICVCSALVRERSKLECTCLLTCPVCCAEQHHASQCCSIQHSSASSGRTWSKRQWHKRRPVVSGASGVNTSEAGHSNQNRQSSLARARVCVLRKRLTLAQQRQRVVK